MSGAVDYMFIQKLMAACAIGPGSSGQARNQVRTFGAMSDDLEQLSDWLTEEGVTHVAMESTASYWKPVYNVLEERFALLLLTFEIGMASRLERL